MIVDVLLCTGSLLLLAGSVFSLLAAIGILRFPDFLTRTHAASKAGVVGGGLVLLAVGIVSLDAGIAVRAVMGIVFLVLTTPLAAHLLARASYQAEKDIRTNTIIDEMQSRNSQTVE